MNEELTIEEKAARYDFDCFARKLYRVKHINGGGVRAFLDFLEKKKMKVEQISQLTEGDIFTINGIGKLTAPKIVEGLSGLGIILAPSPTTRIYRANTSLNVVQEITVNGAVKLADAGKIKDFFSQKEAEEWLMAKNKQRLEILREQWAVLENKLSSPPVFTKAKED